METKLYRRLRGKVQVVVADMPCLGHRLRIKVYGRFIKHHFRQQSSFVIMLKCLAEFANEAKEIQTIQTTISALAADMQTTRQSCRGTDPRASPPLL